MERDLVVCCDGTWNGPDVELVTNVAKLYNCLKQDGTQRCYYQPGVGTSANPLNWLFGGATGAGIRKDIVNTYAWLARHYEPGDRIWLFGFSRGAFTARSIAGMIGRCGLVDGRVDDPRQGAAFHRQVELAFEQYRQKGDRPLLSYAPNGHDRDFPVYFIGVWDTVGALGIPDHLGFLELFDAPQKYQFHDVHLDPRVRHARHCLAVDEPRRPFMPTLWEGENSERMKQVWFPGSHVDVGGGYKDDGLSAGPLYWMINEATNVAPVGLRFQQNMVEAIKRRADPLATLHDDTRAALEWVGPVFMPLKPALDYVFSPRPRSTPAIEENNRWSDREPLGSVHPAVFQRRQGAIPEAGTYHPHVDELEPGSSHAVRVQARSEWNASGLYLFPGTYSLTARGEWCDFYRHWSGPEGEAWGGLRHPLFSAVGMVERGLNMIGSSVPRNLRAYVPGLLRTLLRSRERGEAHSPGTRRVEDMPWMSLVGVVANGRIHGREHTEHQTFLIGKHKELVVETPGYLYAFANHAWSAYPENWGEMELTVRCQSLATQPSVPGTQPAKAVPIAAAAPGAGASASPPGFSAGPDLGGSGS